MSNETWTGSRVRTAASNGNAVLPMPSPRFDEAVLSQSRQNVGPRPGRALGSLVVFVAIAPR